MDDARIAVETGVDGLDVVIGTSSLLREFSHGKVNTHGAWGICRPIPKGFSTRDFAPDRY